MGIQNLASVISGTVTVTDSSHGSVTPGTPGTTSTLIGGEYNTALPTLTTGQQAAVQMDASGRLIVNLGAAAQLPAAIGPQAKAAALAITVATDDPAIGAPADAAWTTGNASLIGLGKAEVAALLAATPAGEAHIGQVGGSSGFSTASPTVQAAAYAAGNCMGTGYMTFAALARANDKTGYIQAATVFSKAAQTAALDLILFGTAPTNSTFTDKSALALAAADLPFVFGVVHISDWTNLGTPGFAQAGNLAIPYRPVSGGTAVYGVLVARAAITPASTSDITVGLRAPQD